MHESVAGDDGLVDALLRVSRAQIFSDAAGELPDRAWAAGWNS